MKDELNYIHKHHWKYGMDFFNHKNIHKYTWEQHTNNLKTIIDYIITKQDLKLKIQDVRAYRGPNCGTDHKLLVAKILFPYMHTATDKHEEKKVNGG